MRSVPWFLLSSCSAAGAWTVLPDTDFPGNDIGSQKLASADACADACNAMAKCAAVSWNGPESAYKDGNCNFKCTSLMHSHAKGEEGVVVRKLKNLCHLPPSPAPPPTPPPGTPAEWLRRFDAAQLLPAPHDEPNAQLGNGYRATDMPNIRLSWESTHVAFIAE